MRRLSSNLTIILRLFLPLIYIVFFGCIIIGSFIITVNDSPLLASPIVKYGMLITYIIFILIMRFTVMPLKRVDAEEDFITISNYIKTYRYTWDSIDKLSTINLLLFDIIYIKFKDKSRFGKKVYFLASRSLVKSFFSDHPNLFMHFQSNEEQVL
jgi:hypothetical protein